MAPTDTGTRVIDVMLTTIDNPYDPLDDFDRWLSYDIAKGYYTCGLLARITNTSAEFSEEFQMRDIEQAIDDWLELDVSGMYKKVARTG